MSYRYHLTSLLFLILLFVGCSSDVSEKHINLKDCIITVPFQYEINKIDKSKMILVSKDRNKPLLNIYLQDNLDAPKGRFKKFLRSYKPTKFINRDNLKVVEGIESHLKEKVYFLIGENFYITYLKQNKDIDKIISECNESWK